ncbi:MAG: TetM/TetW/TetO/TetS family tetracycline resistance ribosomal protection protein [Defluviitaleaceae bacterium]|nr:TetM/TetW/TetO/TetS family tetracycline resistance ribosomal protection protein [Defluviitaleaceae bacterium]
MRLLNLGFLAHVDAGKTTTVEQILYHTGAVRALGTVDKGNTQTDFLPIERQRGISVASASITMEWDNLRVNIIDTPGHMDFTGEVERALSVLDAAVLVVSAAEGIQSQTERFWKALREMGIPTIIFLNKLDRPGCRPDAVLKSLCTKLSPKIIPITHYQNPEQAAQSSKAYGTGISVENSPISEDGILELCENDDELAAIYLEGQDPSIKDIEAALIRQTASATAFPLVHGAAINGIGIPILAQAIKKYLPAMPPAPTGDPAGIVYKIEHDKTLGKVAHVRLYSGSLKNRDTITIHRPGHDPVNEKITQIRKVSGAKREDASQICGNEIAAICGLTGAKVGDMVGQILNRHSPRISAPLFTVQVTGPTGSESQLLQAVSELSAEDPLMDYIWHREERELVISIMGKIQLEVLTYLLQERYNLAVSFSAPSVIYKETPSSQGIGLEQYTMPKPCWAVVKLQADPLPPGSGYKYESIIDGHTLKYHYQNHVAAAVTEALKQGRLGWEVTDLKVTLIDGNDHKFHTHPLDFFLATPIAVMKALENAGPSLLEPLVKLRLTADETLCGRLIGDIIEMRGEFDTPLITGGSVEIEAIVPVATTMDYPARFASLTSGKGIINIDFHGYKKCPTELGAIGKRRGIDPLDRDKWILHKRGALG